MYVISKAIKGKEYFYSKSFTIKCRSKKEAEKLAQFLNKNDANANGCWKLEKNQTWHAYDFDKYDDTPKYKIKATNGRIVVIKNI